MSESRGMMQKWILERIGYPDIHSSLVRIGCDVSLEHVTQALTGERDMDLNLASGLCDVLEIQGKELQEFAVAYMYRHDPNARPDRITALDESRVVASEDIGA